MLKRFLLFSGSYHYPGGGWSDYDDSFDTFEEARDYANTINSDWRHIVDTFTFKTFFRDVFGKWR
jgi:hypothetical protein